MPATSSLGSSVNVEGSGLFVGTTGSAGSFVEIANVDSWALPVKSKTVPVTNVGDHWERISPTLLSMGNITFTIFYQMADATHANTGTGLRKLMLDQTLKDWELRYPDAANSVDAFPAYVTDFGVTGKVGEKVKASCSLANDGAPTLC